LKVRDGWPLAWSPEFDPAARWSGYLPEGVVLQNLRWSVTKCIMK
jgi:hypothetical protein